MVKKNIRTKKKSRRVSHNKNSEINVDKIDDKAFKEIMEKRMDVFKDKRESYLYNNTIKRWKDSNQRNPFDIAIDFIKDKGIKIYGGLALNEYIKQHEDPFYGEETFPDYDVYSPNSWAHAKQLARRLYDAGFKYVEARSSILNDDKHQTYKVSADFDYIMDITQIGCLPYQIKKNDCDKCSIQTLKGVCIDLFNNVPAHNLEDVNTKNYKDVETFRKTYDIYKDKSLYPEKVFITAPQYLKISAYRELSEPITHPDRLPKVSTRTRKLNRYYEWSDRRCNLRDYNKDVNKYLLPILKYIGEFCKNYNMVHYGATAHNVYVKNNKHYNSRHYGSLVVADYNVYSENAEKNRDILLRELTEKFPEFVFKAQNKTEYWKEADSDSYCINVTKKGTNIKYNSIIQITQPVTCIPYIQYNNVKYASVDRLKYIYYRGASIPSVINKVEQNNKNYGCLLSHLLASEKAYNKKRSKHKTKFKRFIGKCKGKEVNKMRKKLLSRWKERHEREVESKVRFNYPEKGLATRIYPMASKGSNMPYRPMDDDFKHNELKPDELQSTKLQSNELQSGNILGEKKNIKKPKHFTDIEITEPSYAAYRRFWRH